jgi:hypothetical protein
MSEPFANKPGPNNPGSNKPGVYNPIRIGDGNGENNSADHFESPLVRVFAALLFTAIFTVVWERPEFGPVTMLVLAGCLLHRLEQWQRKVAAAPLILAAIRLCLLLPAYVADWTGGINIFGTTPSRVPGGDSGIPWLPAFLSVCLFYLPKRDSITLKIVAVEAMAVILSSLLPGEGFLSVLGIFHYTLFFAISIGLILDLKPGVRSLFASGFDPASVRVYRPSATPPPPRPAV